MHKLGLLGGMSWESTREYYRILNEQVRLARGGLHSAPLLIESFDFAPIAHKQAAADWPALERQLAQSAMELERAGAKALLICTNYMHRCAQAVEAAIQIPLIHIADAIGRAALAQGQRRLGLLGASGTMEHPFYRDRLEALGIEVLIPQAEERRLVHQIIFEQLCLGVFSQDARDEYLRIMNDLRDRGAEGVILGCTEIEQLITPEHTSLTLYPSAQIHALAGAEFVLGNEWRASCSGA